MIEKRAYYRLQVKGPNGEWSKGMGFWNMESVSVFERWHKLKKEETRVVVEEREYDVDKIVVPI
jgi:hypothetical protein